MAIERGAQFRLYHGTDSFITGGVVRPRHGSQYAYATTDRQTAKSFGPNVYEVERTLHMEHDPDMDNEPGTEFRSVTGFTVKP